MSEPKQAATGVQARPLIEAPRVPGCLERVVALGIALVGLLYLLNPTFGIIEMIPDNTPIIGNLDEAGATAAMIFALRTLFRRRRGAPPK